MKKLKVDNPLELKKGDLIAISGIREDTEPEEAPLSFDEIMMGARRRKRETVFDGKPWRVITVSMPWILATDGEQRGSFDSRRVEIVLVSKEYARNWRAKEKEDSKKKSLLTGSIRTKKEKKHPSICPRCDVKMKQVLKKDKSGWQWVCSNCDHQGPDVPPVGLG